MNSFQWTEFITIAEALRTEAKAEGSEGKRRSAISRAYYATFHAARDFAVSRFGFDVNAKDVHSRLWKDLREQSGAVMPKVALHGGKLLQLRRRADYDRSPPIGDVEVEQGLTCAKLASQLLQQLMPPSSESP